MLSKKGKLIFNIATLVCVIGCAGFLYFGYLFFRDRTTVFIIYNAYMVLLTGVVIYMIHRYVKTYIT